MSASKLNFKSVRLSKGAVHMYGFEHGHDGHILPPGVVHSLGMEMKRFGRSDYIMIEGTSFVPYPVNPPYRTKSLVYAVRQVPEISRIRKLDYRTELYEWYLLPMFFSETDQKIRQASKGECKLDVTPEDFALFNEKIGRFRNLLVARTAGYRADALKGDVRIFMGSGHVDEAKGFLEQPASVDAYLSGVDDGLRSAYLSNELLQTEITKSFKEKRSQCRPKERPLVLRDTALDVTAQFHLDLMNIRMVPAELAMYLSRLGLNDAQLERFFNTHIVNFSL